MKINELLLVDGIALNETAASKDAAIDKADWPPRQRGVYFG